MPHANYLDDIRQPLAKIAECLGARVDQTTEKAMGRLFVDVDGTAATIFVNQAWNGKISLSIDNANVPHKAWNQYGRVATPTISATLTRDPLALAKDIERRLLAPASDALAENWRRAMAYLAAQDDRASFAQELARDFPGMIKIGEHDGGVHFTAMGAVSLSGSLESGDAIHLRHGQVRGKATIRALLTFLRDLEAVT